MQFICSIKFWVELTYCLSTCSICIQHKGSAISCITPCFKGHLIKRCTFDSSKLRSGHIATWKLYVYYLASKKRLWKTTSAAVAGKVKAYHHSLQVSNVVVHVYRAGSCVSCSLICQPRFCLWNLKDEMLWIASWLWKPWKLHSSIFCMYIWYVVVSTMWVTVCQYTTWWKCVLLKVEVFSSKDILVVKISVNFEYKSFW